MTLQLTGTNRNGSPELSLSDGNNTTFAWSPFGGSATRTGITASLPGFNSERQDPLSGVTHLGNGYRAYSPALRRFTCPDCESPFGVGGINPYVYCNHDPVNNTDPSGHMPKGEIVAGARTRKRREAIDMTSLQTESLPTSLPQITPDTSGTASSVTGVTGNAASVSRRRSIPERDVQGLSETDSQQISNPITGPSQDEMSNIPQASTGAPSQHRVGGEINRLQTGMNADERILLGFHGSSPDHEASLMAGIKIEGDFTGAGGGTRHGIGFYIASDYGTAEGYAFAANKSDFNKPRDVYAVYARNKENVQYQTLYKGSGRRQTSYEAIFTNQSHVDGLILEKIPENSRLRDLKVDIKIFQQNRF